EHEEESGLVRREYETTVTVPPMSEGFINIEIGERYNPAIQETIEFGVQDIFNRTVIDVDSYGEPIRNALVKNSNYGNGKVYIIEGGVQEAELDLVNGVSPKKEFILKNGTRIRVEHVGGKLKLTPIYWTQETTEKFDINYFTKIGSTTFVGSFHFTIETPNRYVALVGDLDFGRIMKGFGNIKAETELEVYYNNTLDGIRAEYSLDTDGAGGHIWLDDNKKLKVDEIKIGTHKIDPKMPIKTTIPISGIIRDTSQVSPGKYEKTLQLIIRLR
ncbi:MAG: hypothetical protein ACRC40_03495, partial [Fusobacteriaceae bacterium]